LNHLPELSAIFERYERRNDGNKAKPKKSKKGPLSSPSGIWNVFNTHLLWINRQYVRSAMIKLLFKEHVNVTIIDHKNFIVELDRDKFYFRFCHPYVQVQGRQELMRVSIWNLKNQYYDLLNKNKMPTTRIDNLTVLLFF